MSAARLLARFRAWRAERRRRTLYKLAAQRSVPGGGGAPTGGGAASSGWGVTHDAGTGGGGT